MWGTLGIILLIVGVAGVGYQGIRYVKEVLPDNYGNNPGFGCFEVMVTPWHAAASIGLGLFMQSWMLGVVVLGIGLFCYGFLAMLLGRLFGDD